MTEWKAEVTVSGVPSISLIDLEAMLAVAPMILSHSAEAGELTMKWRFGDGATVTAAIERASHMWRAALGNASGIEALSPDVMCTDFRVCRAGTDEEAEAELKKIFGED